YRWPGNVRELAHLIERLYILSDDDRVRVSDLPARMTDPGFWSSIERVAGTSARKGEELSRTASLDEATLGFQRNYIRLALEGNSGNVARAAEALGITRHALRYRMMKL